MITEYQKQWIDNADYEILLERWRNAPVGDKMFQDDVGEYYQKVMIKKRDAITNEEGVIISKKIGWK
jgi:hypothetical protein